MSETISNYFTCIAMTMISVWATFGITLQIKEYIRAHKEYKEAIKRILKLAILYYTVTAMDGIGPLGEKKCIQG